MGCKHSDYLTVQEAISILKYELTDSDRYAVVAAIDEESGLTPQINYPVSENQLNTSIDRFNGLGNIESYKIVDYIDALNLDQLQRDADATIRI